MTVTHFTERVRNKQGAAVWITSLGTFFVSFFFSFIWPGCFALAAPNQLGELRKLENEGAKISVSLTNLSSRKKLMVYHSKLKLIPASVSKLVTAAAVLEKFGPDFSFKTKVYRRGNRTGTVLHGDIILDGSGDPGLTNEKLWFLASDVSRMGIKTVKGNLVINTSKFADIPLDENRAAGVNYSRNAYNSPLSSAAVNYSVMAVVAGPGDFKGDKAKVAIEPFMLPYFKLKESVITSGAGQQNLQVSRSKTEAGETIAASGQVSLSGFPVRSYKSISDANRYAGEVFRSFLEGSGVKILGKVVIEKSPPNLANFSPLSEVDGYPVDYHLQGLFKVSNNFIADMLTVNLAAKSSDDRGLLLSKGAQELEIYLKNIVDNSKSMEKSRFDEKQNSASADDVSNEDRESGVVNSSLNSSINRENKGINGKMVILSGSGLTPQNRISAADFDALLEHMYHQPNLFPSFLAALPTPGNEGTLLKRFSQPNAKHLATRLRGKTGTLTEPIDAVGLAGYVRLKNGDWVSFAILVNGSAKNPNLGVERIRSAMDRDLVALFPNDL